jgi:hypothetical protein
MAAKGQGLDCQELRSWGTSGMLIARITLDGQLVHTEKVIIGH